MSRSAMVGLDVHLEDLGGVIFAACIGAAVLIAVIRGIRITIHKEDRRATDLTNGVGPPDPDDPGPPPPA